MVEKLQDKMANDKQADATVQQNAHSSSKSANGVTHEYKWLLNGEDVITVLPVKYGLTLSAVRSEHSSKLKSKKIKIRNIVATNYRVAYLDGQGELFFDKKKEKEGRNGRQFFFYDKDALENYLSSAIKHNNEVVENYKKQNPKFAKYYDKTHIPGKFGKELFKQGYLASIYVLNDVAETKESAFKKGHVNKSLAGRWVVNHSISGSANLLDMFKHGFALNGSELYLPGFEMTMALEDPNTKGRALTKLQLFNSRSKGVRKSDLYVRYGKGSADDLKKFIESIMDKVVAMRAYEDKSFAQETYKNLARKDNP
ncbi:hypothetical protein M1567_01895 [Candidatus Marsarchaeota archaeon]|nr:hypothetical protein [Candidatus Marsarchaeota archaeon]